MLSRRAAAILSVATLLVVAGCGTETPVGTREAPHAEPANPPPTAANVPEVIPWDKTGNAPPITLDLDGKRVPLAPWTTCYTVGDSGGCWDGAPRRPYLDVGRRETVPFSFPERGWEFEVTFREAGNDGCARRITLPVEKTSDRTWVIDPVGPAGAWDVDVFGRGPQGDVITTFSWTTTTDGRLPGPATGSVAVLADHDGDLDSYGVEIGVRDLALQPRQASAAITVTSVEGRSVTITPRWQRPCYDEGALWFTASDTEGRRATELGHGPFTYVVELDLDGTSYTGRGAWPTGETEEIAPHVPLTWTPELPAYDG